MLLISFVELRVVAGRNRTPADRLHAVSGRPMLILACNVMSMQCCAVALRSRFQKGMILARHGHGMECVNQMGNTQSEPLVERHGNGMTWARHGMCGLAL
jgi:hypothetical protein